MYRQHCPLVALLIDCFIRIQHTCVCPKGRSTPYLHNGGFLQYNDLFITRSFNRYNCKLLPRYDYSNTCQYSHNVCTMTLG